MVPRFSIVIPARDEERFIGACLESIRTASVSFPDAVEIIVVLNRCTDRTEAIAHSFGARTIREDARNLSRIRNAGARSATGEILITIDADSVMTPGTLVAVDCAISSGTTIGGGTLIRPERTSPGIQVTVWLLTLFQWVSRISAGLFWCLREDFLAVGGFNETRVSAEDLDFAWRLKAYGKQVGRPYTMLQGGHIITSCRKFDAYGDWCVLTNPRLMWRLARGAHQSAADAFYYDFRH